MPYGFFPSFPFPSLLPWLFPQLTAVKINCLPLLGKPFTSLFPDFPQVLLSNEPITSPSHAITLINLSVQHLQQQPPDWKRTCFLKWHALPPPSKSTVEMNSTELKPPRTVFQWQAEMTLHLGHPRVHGRESTVPCTADWKAAACSYNVDIL